MNKKLFFLITVIVVATIMYFISGITPANKITCTQESLICPDGSSVGRSGPKCEFSPCPTIFRKPEQIKQGKFCGGIVGVSCPEGYDCQLDGDYPDAGGTCVKTTQNFKN